MIHIAIAENDPADLEQLKSFCKRFFASIGEDIRFSVYENGLRLTENYPAEPDILFLDIAMPLCNGIHAARRVREFDPKVMILFVTNMVQYVFQGYEVNAFDFVVKPLMYSSFSAAMERAMRQLKKRTPAYLKIDFEKRTRLVDVSAILYIETLGKKTLIHLRGEACPCGESMKELERRLEPLGFCRCHQAYIVNLDYVTQVGVAEIQLGEAVIPISRSREAEFLAALTNHVGGIL